MTYSYFKLLHLVAVVMFLGNIITGLFWMQIAVRTKDLKIIHHSAKGVIKSDGIFTGPGFLLIVFGGVMSAIYGHLPILRTGWIFWSIILFTISGIAFAWKIAPAQRKICKLTERYEQTNFDWTGFNKLYLEWEIWGLVAVIAPLGAFVMMILKMPQ